MKLPLLDQFLLARQMGKKVRIINSLQGIKKYKCKELGGGIAYEHTFLLENCVFIFIEDRRG